MSEKVFYVEVPELHYRRYAVRAENATEALNNVQLFRGSVEDTNHVEYSFDFTGHEMTFYVSQEHPVWGDYDIENERSFRLDDNDQWEEFQE